jgi:hypothetical protein
MADCIKRLSPLQNYMDADLIHTHEYHKKRIIHHILFHIAVLDFIREFEQPFHFPLILATTKLTTQVCIINVIRSSTKSENYTSRLRYRIDIE